MSDFCRDLAALIHFGFGYITEDSGSVLFELETQIGHPLTVRIPADTIRCVCEFYVELPAPERANFVFEWMAILEIEAENRFLSEPPETRGRHVYDM